MRITGGTFGGRLLRVPGTGDIRPTQDRVREALFSMIQFELSGADFLDLFAGSGAVGLEALSRGAATVTFVERDRRHADILRKNIAEIAAAHAAACRVVVADVYRHLDTCAGSGFHLAFADPPYALGEARGYAAVLATLANRCIVRPGGLFAAEMTAVQKAEETPGWELVRDRLYGKTRLCLWRRT